MNLRAVDIPQPERRIGQYIPHRERSRAPDNIHFRYDWKPYTREDGGRGYIARVNDSLVLNVHKRTNSRTWEYLVIGFDLTKEDHPVIGATGTSDTMKEAKYLAENKISRRTPGTQMTFDEDLPF